jgi:hypothetical protein
LISRLVFDMSQSIALTAQDVKLFKGHYTRINGILCKSKRNSDWQQRAVSYYMQASQKCS